MRSILLKYTLPLSMLVVLLICRASVFAVSDRMDNYTYVKSGEDGIFYARCIPAAKEGSGGRTEVYRVREDKDELLDRYDVYPRTVVLGWSPIVGKVAVMAIIREEAKDWKGQEEFRFMIGGMLLKKYTSAEVVGLGAAEEDSSPGGHRAAYRVGACKQVPGTPNEYDFVVELKDGAKVRFDILTGKVRPAKL